MDLNILSAPIKIIDKLKSEIISINKILSDNIWNDDSKSDDGDNAIEYT